MSLYPKRALAAGPRIGINPVSVTRLPKMVVASDADQLVSIIRILNAMGWLNSQIARALGVSQSAVCLWKQNKRSPRYSTLLIDAVGKLLTQPVPEQLPHGRRPKRRAVSHRQPL